MAYVILCKEPDVDAYVLGDGSESFLQAQTMMHSRAEELLDELATVDAENDEPVGDRIIRFDKTGTNLYVHPIVDGVEQPALITLSLVAVTIHG